MGSKNASEAFLGNTFWVNEDHLTQIITVKHALVVEPKQHRLIFQAIRQKKLHTSRAEK